MKSFTILRNILFAVVMMLCSLPTAAQVPTTMDYQIMATNPKTGMVLANKDLTIRVELRLNAADGEIVWSKEETLTSSKSGICTISLDFADVDWNQGNYFIKAFVNGESVGASQIKSVPFALIADGVRGVLSKRQLIGTWKASRVEKGSLTYHTFNLEKDGSFSYTRKDDYEPEYYSGTWKINSLGFITFNVTKASPYTDQVGKFVMFSVYDKDDKSLYLGGNDDFLGDGLSLYKQ
ncbi:hypothetical protein RJT11_12815 [Segatella copri]|uniref:hypothetical protein n=1 Tax=Segatella copri TaxID=165179 RepID=UPI00294B5827|nr:hypothetical protein [Segatella copri]WOG03085.1 hypothetical protein RJT11_12815 [Segatella copri]